MSGQKQTAQQRILRIGLFQNKTCLEERLIHSTKPITLGQDLNRNTFVVPVAHLPKSVTVFDVKDGKFILEISGDMHGRVSLGDGKPVELSELIKQGKAQKSANGYSLPISEKTFGRVALGKDDDEVALLFQFVKPPPPRVAPVLPASMRGGLVHAILESTTFAFTTGISALVQIGFIAFILSHDWPKPRDMDYKMPDRFISIMVDKKPEPVEPEPMTDETGDGPAEEGGQEEPGPAKEPEESKTPKSAEDRAAADAERKRRLSEEVQNKTILGQIGALSSEGGGLIDTLSEGAGKTSMEEAFANSTGIATNVAGAEKSGLRTSGSSDADGKGSTVGIGDLKGLKGATAAEKGVDTGSKGEKAVKVRVNMSSPEKVVGTGKLDAGSISDVIRRRQSSIQKCYEREIKKNPKASGKVVVTFTIGTAGRVTAAKAVTDSVGGGVGQCVASTIEGFRFPKPAGGEVIVNKTFVFEVSQ